MKKVGFFIGTFDPIHNGHISLAVQISEIHRLDEVILCPAFCSPFKKNRPPAVSAEQRLQMVQAAIQDIPRFSASDREIRQDKIVFTIDLVKEILNEEKNLQLHLIFSEDTLNGFPQWKEVDELIRLAPPFIGSRLASPRNIPADLKEKLKKGFTQTKMMDISSTEIRERLKKELYCGHLVPAKVLDYIRVYQLYL